MLVKLLKKKQLIGKGANKGDTPTSEPITPEQLEEFLNKMRQITQQLSHLKPTVQQGLPHVEIEQLDHVIHDMRLKGELEKLTDQQVTSIIYSLQLSGHLKNFRDLRGAYYDDGYLTTFFNGDFQHDPLFKEAYRLGHLTHSYPGADIRWRVYVICWAASHAKHLDGDFVECGVNRGGFARSLIHYIDFQNIKNKTFYLLDTFEGIPKEDKHLAGTVFQNAYSECYEEVKETFKNFSNVEIIRGQVPYTLSQVPSKKISFLSIDMNYAEPEIAAAEFFWDKLVSGAVVVLDDYGGGEYNMRQKEFFDRFAKEKGVGVLSLPTSQGLIFKP